MRKVEELVRTYLETGSFSNKSVRKNIVNKLQEYKELKFRLSKLFGTDVNLNSDEQGKGKISIAFQNDDELGRIMDLFDKINRQD